MPLAAVYGENAPGEDGAARQWNALGSGRNGADRLDAAVLHDEGRAGEDAAAREEEVWQKSAHGRPRTSSWGKSHGRRKTSSSACARPSSAMRSIAAELKSGSELYREVVLDKLAGARESVSISTANLKDMHVEGRSVVALFAELAARGVQLRLLHAELPSRPFRASFEKRRRLWDKLELKICPRVHFKAVIVDKAWLYLGSANLTGAGLGAKGEGRRNFELGICTEDFDTIDRVSALFEAVWSGAECGACRLRRICPDPIAPADAKSMVRLGHSRRLGR